MYGKALNPDRSSTAWRAIWFQDDRIFIRTASGEERSMPLEWFPRLYNASQAECEQFELSPFEIHWPALDEDLSFELQIKDRQCRQYLFVTHTTIDVTFGLFVLNPSPYLKNRCGNFFVYSCYRWRLPRMHLPKTLLPSHSRKRPA
ncbi:DUF2442 domain-containing protein [Dyadobacter sp. 22481]|uniref:DUF2442 domain-containing protein n=1 Tax=Dyadobacter sp. 22481 TaxID=3453926 RepID=UPI003F841E90